MAREFDGDQECECGLSRAEHDGAPFSRFGDECLVAQFYDRVERLVADAPPAFRGSDVTFTAGGWEGMMTEPEASAVELLAEQVAAACEERDGPLPVGPENCEGCGRDPGSHIGGPILERAMGGACEIGAWEDRAYALQRDLAAASVLSLSVVPGGFDMDSGSVVDREGVTLRLVIE